MCVLGGLARAAFAGGVTLNIAHFSGAGDQGLGVTCKYKLQTTKLKKKFFCNSVRDSNTVNVLHR